MLARLLVRWLLENMKLKSLLYAMMGCGILWLIVVAAQKNPSVHADAPDVLTAVLSAGTDEEFAMALKAVEWKDFASTYPKNNAGDLLKICQRIILIRETDKSLDSCFGTVFGQACRHGAPEDFPVLRELFVNNPLSYLKKVYMKDFTSFWLRWKLAQLEKIRPPPIVIESNDDKIEKMASHLSRDELEAWKTYRRIMQPWNDSVFAKNHGYVADNRRLSYTYRGDQFWQMVEDMISGKRAVSAEKIFLWEWMADCGTNAFGFFEAKRQALLIALLMEERYDLAIASVLSDNYSTLWFSPERVPMFQRLVELCGIDYQTFCRGAYVDARISPERRFNPYALRLLVGAGDEPSIRVALKEAEKMRDNDLLSSYELDFLSALVDASGDAKNRKRPYGYGGRMEISHGLRDDIIRFMTTLLAPESNPEKCREVIKRLAQTKSPLIVDPLRAVIRTHPSKTVCDEAVTAIKGITGYEPVVPKKPGPVYYKISINGKPLANTEVRSALYVFKGNRREVATRKGSTNENGILKLDRDFILRATGSGGRLVFSRYGGEALPEVPVFFAEAPVARLQTSEIVSVDIQSAPMIFDFNLTHPIADYKVPIYACFVWMSDDERMEGSRDRAIGIIRLSESVVFPSVALGRYNISINIGEFGEEESAVVHFAKSRHAATLAPRVDAIMRLRFPDNETHKPLYYKGYWKMDSGKTGEVSIRGDRVFFRNMPFGHYTLTVELPMKITGDEVEDIITGKMKSYKADFTITADVSECSDLQMVACEKP
ncbi:hypothetical protein M2447_001677 [Ereboglobus sp. PH5-10]|uniref:hypothetical protein n=1 Tax=Ereboglobus sp. PH5-10 TaxID=2940629 RepID=UPI002405290E|nr:hypothetical protein [Ereboglobus sp. PH5-10]MDF9827579.1 hypothetical protein [Ereboglobus sp. PH5-10]